MLQISLIVEEHDLRKTMVAILKPKDFDFTSREFQFLTNILPNLNCSRLHIFELVKSD